jgi:hypothetical protein
MQKKIHHIKKMSTENRGTAPAVDPAPANAPAPANTTNASTPANIAPAANVVNAQDPTVDAMREIMERLNFMETTESGIYATQNSPVSETVLILQQQDRTLQVLVDVLCLDVPQARDLLEQCAYDIAAAVSTYYSHGSSSSKKRGWAPSGESPAKLRTSNRILLLRGTPVGWECYSKPNGVVFFHHIQSGTECLEARIQLPTCLPVD